MEFGQFVIMFKALFLEGFARPFDGVRVILRVLLEKYRAAGGERRMKCGVQRIVAQRRPRRRAGARQRRGDHRRPCHLARIGAAGDRRALRWRASAAPSRDQPPTPTPGASLVRRDHHDPQPPAGRARVGRATRSFFSTTPPRFDYARAGGARSIRAAASSACRTISTSARTGNCPREFSACTCLANYDRWAHLPEDNYQADKQRWFAEVQHSARRFLPAVRRRARSRTRRSRPTCSPRARSRNSPATSAARSTARPVKNRQGRTALANLYLCGTDQGFLGIVGAMLSGISMANYHILAKN